MINGKVRLAGASVAVLFSLAGCGEDTLPAAADGTDLAACSDGTCEVLVEPGDVLDIPDLGRVEVAIDGDMLEVASRSDDGQGTPRECPRRVTRANSSC